MTELAALLQGAAQQLPDKVILGSASDSREVSRGQLSEATRCWSERLEAAGIPERGRVGLQGRDPLLLAMAWLGVIASGRCVAPIGPDVDDLAMTRWRSDIQPWTVIAADAQGLDGSGPGLVVSPGLDSDAGVLLASSGTTGPAKLVSLTEAQLLATARNVVEAHELTEADRCLNPLPLWHINAEVVALLATLVSGGAVIFDERFRRTGFWEVVSTREITWINAVPAILAILARDKPRAESSATVRFARSASAPLPPSVQKTFESVTGIPVVQTYGMTEAASQICAERLPSPAQGQERGSHEGGSVGRPVGIELRILDDDDAPVEQGQTGRVQIRGPGVITAYASAAGAEHITSDGWIDTADLGWLDAGGDLHLEGRRDDVINRGGEKFSPLHIEDALLDVPGVASIAVVGVPDDVLGQVAVAVVVGDGSVSASDLEAGLRKAAEARLDRVRRPVRFHHVDTLNAGVNGKISRRAITRMLVELGMEGVS